MAERPKLAAAMERVMGLTYPPTTLAIAVSRAAGHRLARAVVARGNQPSRPLALVDGLAVLARDVITSGTVMDAAPALADEAPEEANGAVAQIDETESDQAAGLGAGGALLADDTHQRPAAAAPADELSLEPEAALDLIPPPLEPEPPAEPSTPVAGSLYLQDLAGPPAQLELRPFPHSNRREDALGPHQAIAVVCGGEVPRGGEAVYPLSWIVAEPEPGQAAPAVSEPVLPPPPPLPEEPGEGESGEGEDDDLPVKEPPRDWDLAARYTRGSVELPRLRGLPEATMVPIGAWARNREVILPEKTVLRAPEMAILTALGIEEVDVFRRPVVGIASLGHPFPVAGRAGEREDKEGVCPLMTLAMYLARAARVAALPLGFAPNRFRDLKGLVERWISQVDILLLVGGSHHGPRCLGLDVLSGAGEVALSGLDLTPGGDTSLGKVGGRPLVVIPGSLPDVLVSVVLLARPLMHKYLMPHHYSGTIDLVLERGSALRVDRDTAVPVRFGLDREQGVFATRFAGQRHDPWLDYARGQALVVLEAGVSYRDGQVVTAYSY